VRKEDLKIPILLALVVLVVPIAGCPEDGEDDDYGWLKPSEVLFEFKIDDVKSREIEGTTYYDIYITVEEIVKPENHYNWTDIEISLSNPDVGVFIETNPGDMTWFPGNTTDIQFFYDDFSGHAIWMDPLDQIIITHLTEENQGNRCGIEYKDEGGGWFDLPDDFTDY
jgi:hypothetical protein